MSGLFVAMFVACGLSAGDLAKLWELRISDLLGESVITPTAHIDSVSFSPDGGRLALVSRGEHGEAGVLVVLDIRNPHEGITAVPYDGPTAPEEYTGPAISWSPDGAGIAVPGIFQKVGQPGCTLSHTIHAAFYDVDRVADIQPGFPESVILLFNANCDAIGSWKIEGKWELTDGSPDRHLLLAESDTPKEIDVLVLDPTRRKVVRRWQVAGTSGSWPLFADRGNAVCATAGTGRKGEVHCWDVEGDREIREASPGNPHKPMAASLHAQRLILSDYNWRIDFERWESEVGSLAKRLVWDFGTGKELVSWRPRYQDNSPGFKEPYGFAVSPDGSMVAEAGDGNVILYRISP
jgi:WD40 repeat protein